MMNTSLFEKMISRYNELSYTHNYIYGFYFQNNVYMVEATAEVMPYILKLDKASRGAGYSLRFCPISGYFPLRFLYNLLIDKTRWL